MRALERLWWRRDEPGWTEAWAFPLSLSALALRAGAALRASATTSEQVSAPVISVGNLAVGGAGKTPVAMFLCERLRALGRKPALLSRGYGRTAKTEWSLVCAGQGPLCGANEAGDEPLLIARRCPWLTILVGAKRTLLAREAEARGADVLVLDDGLQHRALARDLDVIVLDAQNPLGNGRRLPRGPLREGPEAFWRVGSHGLVWLTRARDPSLYAPELKVLLDAARAAGLAGVVESENALRVPPEMVGVPTFLLAGIARPERFEASMRASSADIRGAAFFADHHEFSEAELVQTRAAALGAGARRIATTEKDAARLSSSALRGEPPIVPVPIELELLRGAEALDAALARALSAKSGSAQ